MRARAWPVLTYARGDVHRETEFSCCKSKIEDVNWKGQLLKQVLIDR